MEEKAPCWRTGIYAVRQAAEITNGGCHDNCQPQYQGLI
jgi:hypothetical protein